MKKLLLIATLFVCPLFAQDEKAAQIAKNEIIKQELNALTDQQLEELETLVSEHIKNLAEAVVKAGNESPEIHDAIKSWEDASKEHKVLCRITQALEDANLDSSLMTLSFSIDSAL